MSGRIFFIISVVISVVAYFALTKKNDKVEAAKKQLDEFSEILVAEFLDEGCNFLNRADKRKLRWHIFHIDKEIVKKHQNLKAQKNMGSDPLSVIKDLTRKASLEEKYSGCSKASRQTVDAMKTFSPKMLKSLTGEKYVVGKSYKQFVIDQYKHTVSLIKYTEGCAKEFKKKGIENPGDSVL